VLHLTPTSLYTLGFRGYAIGGVECILPPICPVPGGVFTMGSDKARDKEARDNETPQYPVSVGDVAIGQYPVTVAEYACVVRPKAVPEPPPFELYGKITDWRMQRTHLTIRSSAFPGRMQWPTRAGWQRSRTKPGGCRRKLSGKRCGGCTGKRVLGNVAAPVRKACALICTFSPPARRRQRRWDEEGAEHIALVAVFREMLGGSTVCQGIGPL
jgi:hypothetical protein